MKDEEHKIQTNGVALCRQVFPICKELLYAVPNGGIRPTTKMWNMKRGRYEDVPIAAKRLKDEGVLAGVFDLSLDVVQILTYTIHGCAHDVIVCPGLKIEVKTPTA